MWPEPARDIGPQACAPGSCGPQARGAPAPCSVAAARGGPAWPLGTAAPRPAARGRRCCALPRAVRAARAGAREAPWGLGPPKARAGPHAHLGRKPLAVRPWLAPMPFHDRVSPLCDIPSGCCSFTGPCHPFFPSHVASGRCVMSAAAACAPAGVVSAFAEPSSWCVGTVLNVARAPPPSVPG